MEGNNNQEDVENNLDTTNNGIVLMDLLKSLLSKWWMILISVILTSILGAMYTKVFVTPMYESTATVYVMPSDTDKEISSSDVNLYENLAKDYIYLIKDRTVLQNAINECEIIMSVSSLSSNLSIKNIDKTRLLYITVKNKDAETAKKLCDSICHQGDLKIKEVVSTEVNIVSDGSLANSPVSPSLKRNVMLSFLVGLIISVGVLIVIYVLDDKIKKPEDIEKYLGLSVLGSISHISDNNKNKKYNYRYIHNKN